jgi:subfamily B ATP-binding cassette protein MsbA
MSKSNAVFELLKRQVRSQKSLFALGITCALLVSATSLAPALAGKFLMDSMTTKNRAGINMAILILVGSYTIRWFFAYGQMVAFAEAGQRITLQLRQEIYRHLQSLSMGFFNRQRTGALMSTMTNDVPILQSAVSGLKDVAPAPFTAIGGLILAYTTSPALFWASLLALPGMAISINRLNRQIKSITADTQDKVADVNVMMEETLSGIRVIQSFSAENHEIARFDRENIAAKNLFMKSIRRQAMLKPTIDVIGALGVGAALWYGGALILSGHFTVGDLTKFVIAMNQVAVGLSGLGSGKATWEQSQGAGERIIKNVLSIESDIKDAPNATPLGDIAGKIEFEKVSFSYNADTPVLREVSFTMNPGEVVAVVGASGAGKSTLADLIPRFYDPTGGAVLVDGHDLRGVALQSLRKHIGIVPQETVLFGGTIRDNIVYGDPTATDEMVEQAARAANAHDFIMDPRMLPDGYNTIVGERGKQLSGGQRQRIAIARALLKNPRILILDEATSSLDAASEILVQEALDELMQGRTTLVIAHRLSTIINANKILVMQNGRVVEQGTHADLIKVPGGIYAGLYETQFRWEEPKTLPAT